MSGIPSWSKSASGAGSGGVKRLFSDLGEVAGDEDKKPKPVKDKTTGTMSSKQPSNRTSRRHRVFMSANMRRIIGGAVDLGQDIGNSLKSG